MTLTVPVHNLPVIPALMPVKCPAGDSVSSDTLPLDLFYHPVTHVNYTQVCVSHLIACFPFPTYLTGTTAPF